MCFGRRPSNLGLDLGLRLHSYLVEPSGFVLCLDRLSLAFRHSDHALGLMPVGHVLELCFYSEPSLFWF